MARLNYIEAAPDAYQAVVELERYVTGKSGLDPELLILVKLRASQINGCAFCVDMHTKEAKRQGKSEQWLALLCVWREASIFDQRERALLSWTEALTRFGEKGVPDQVYQEMTDCFSDEEICKLSVAVGLINIWNRLAVAFQSPHPVDQ